MFSFGQLKTHTGKHSLKDEQQYVHYLLQCQQARHVTRIASMPNAKTTTTAERVIASSRYNYTDTLTGFIGKTDSSRFVYSAGRGSTFDFSGMSYSNAWASNGSVAYPYGLNTGTIAQAGTPGVFSDTTWIFQNAFPFIDSVFLLDKRNIVYDSNYNVIDYADLYLQDSSAYYLDNRSLNSYDAYKNPNHSYVLSWDMAAWDTSEYRIFTYNGSHRIVKDSTILYVGGGVYVPEYRWNYIVNYFGNDSIAYLASYDTVLHIWDTTEQQFSYYYSDSLLQLYAVTMKDSAGHFMNSFTDSFKYAAGTSTPNYIKEQLFDVTGILQIYSIETRHMNASHLLDTIYYKAYDAGNNLIQAWNETVLYDAFYNPTQILHYNYNFDSTGTSGTYSTSPDSKQFFYYETFTPAPYWISSAPGASVVNTAVKGNENFKVYPNPSRSVFTVEYGDMKDDALMNVTDVTGRLIYSLSIKGGGNKAEINANSWLPGIYFYRVSNTKGNIISAGKMIKE